MPINKTAINAKVINGSGSAPRVFSGQVFGVSQQVVQKGSGPVFGVTQNVHYLATQAATSVVKFEQKIKIAQALTPVLSITQNVVAPTFTLKNGWDAYLYINGQPIARSVIGDDIIWGAKEGGAKSLKFTLIPTWGVQNPEQYIGLPVFLNISKLVSGVVKTYRAFTGWVDTPKIDLIERKIHYECSDRRRQQIMQLPYSTINNIGYYSRYVFGDPQDQEDELNRRLETVPASFDFDQWGNPQYALWHNPSVTNWTYTNSDVYYENPYPTVEYRSRESKVNTVLINVRYTYKRLIQQVALVSWSGYQDFYNDWWLQGTPTFPTRSMVQTAANSTSWFPIRPVNFVPLWPAGGYNGITWQPNQVTNNYTPMTSVVVIPYIPPGGSPTNIWPDGKEHAINQTTLDANGNPIMTLSSQTIVDTSSKLCRGATWFAAKHITQSMTEYYPIEISSPSGVSTYGKILKQENITINDGYETTGWINQKSINTINTPAATALNMTTDTAGYAQGSRQITLLSGASGTLYYGNMISFSNDPSGMNYMVAANINVSGGATITIFGGLHAPLPATSGSVNVIPQLGANSGYYDFKSKVPDLHTAISALQKRASTTIQKSYRDVTVKIKRFISPEVDLSHYIQLNCDRITAHGKVSSLEHKINIQTGEAYSMIDLLLSRPPAVDTATPLQVNIPPYEDTSYIVGNLINVNLGTHTGVSPDPSVNPLAITYNGYVGNANLNPSFMTPKRTTYQEQFICEYPALDPMITNPRIITQQAPGTASGAQTDTAGYLAGVTQVHLAASGTGYINAGDTFNIVGDPSNTLYTAANDVLNISTGGVLNFYPALVNVLGTVNNALTFYSDPNKGTISVPQDSLTETFL